MKKTLSIFTTILAFSSFSAVAADVAEYKIIIKDHKFMPQSLEIPAGQKVKLIIDNQDKTAEEFESYDLKKEKIVAGNKKITIFVGPLKTGTYKYFGEFNQATAQGVIVVK